MLPQKDFSDIHWHLYERLLDPVTQTIRKTYFLPLLISQSLYSRLSQQPLSIAFLEFPLLPSGSRYRPRLNSDILFRNITTTIKHNLRLKDVVFYNGAQQFILLLPQANKNAVKKLLERIKNKLAEIYVGNIPLIIKGGFATTPQDANSPLALEKCVRKALHTANSYSGNKIIAYFRERRHAVRIPFLTEVRYRASGTNNRRLVCSRNLSELGIKISGMPDLQLGNDIELSFKIPGSRKKIIIKAQTIWHKPLPQTNKMDMGLCFVDSDNITKQLIEKYVQKVLAALKQKSKKRT